MTSREKIQVLSKFQSENNKKSKKKSQMALKVETFEIDEISHCIGPNITTGVSTGYFGHIDSLDQYGASGWVVDVSRLSTNVKVTAYINEIVIGKTETKNFRSDICEIVRTNGNFGFTLIWDAEAIRKAILHYQEDQICPIKLFPDNEARHLLNIFHPTVAEVKTWLFTMPCDGHLDHIDSNFFASGWAVNLKSTTPALVEILVNGAVVATQEAKLPRPDLILSNPENIMSGFKVAIPKKAMTGSKNRIDARVNGFFLKSSPIWFCVEQRIHVDILNIKNNNIFIKITFNTTEIPSIEGQLYIDGVLSYTVTIEETITKNRSAKDCLIEWELPEHLIDGQPHVYFFVVRSGENIFQSDTTILSYPQYRFEIDVANSSTISGWLFRHDKVSPIHLCMRSGDFSEQYTFTDISRQDVRSAQKIPHEYTGFEFKFEEKHIYQGADFELYDTETNIKIAIITIFSFYESLASLAIEVARLPKPSFAIRNNLSQILMQSKGLTSYSIKRLPPISHKIQSQQIDIIIPIYGGVAETIECLESVFASKNNTPARIIIINDCTPDQEIKNYLALLEKREKKDVIILHRAKNGGFSEAVNIGMIVAGDRDVILLNADTVVQSGWIDRIVNVSRKDARIGTITPFSNNGEICTFPYMCKSLPVHDLDLALEIDNIAASANLGKIVDIPVAVGFCMYIRRECINEVGLFDAAMWGRGYGEEVDFCLKASAFGWRHVMVSDTFIVHRGNVSFGDEKLERIKVSAKKISERYPFYDQVIQRFLEMDPASKLRRAINITLIGKKLSQNRILHITHNFGGGTEQYINDMVILNRQAGYTPLVLRFSSTGEATLTMELSGTRLVGLFADQHEENYTKFETQIILNDIAKLEITKLHIHSPFGIPTEFIDLITANYNFNITVHDYSWICPRVNLTLLNGIYCNEPEPKKCTECVKFNKPHPGLQHFVVNAKENITEYRVFFSKIFSRAEKIFGGAKDVIERMQHHEIQGKYIAIPHPIVAGSVFSQTQNLEIKWDGLGKISVAMFGGISDIKGFHVLLECAEYALKRNLPIQFILFGYTMNDDLCRAHSNIKLLGRYTDDSLNELVEANRPHLSFFPNQCPETFSYTLSHSLRLGIWPIVADIGAPAERVRECGIGAVYPFSLNIPEICDFIIKQAISRSNTPKFATIL